MRTIESPRRSRAASEETAGRPDRCPRCRLPLTDADRPPAPRPSLWPVALWAAALAALAGLALGAAGYAYVQRQAALEAEERSRKATDDGWDRQQLADLREQLAWAELAPQLADLNWQMAEVRLQRARQQMGLPAGVERAEAEHADAAKHRLDSVRAAVAERRARVVPRIDKILERHPGWK